MHTIVLRVNIVAYFTILGNSHAKRQNWFFSSSSSSLSHEFWLAYKINKYTLRREKSVTKREKNLHNRLIAL